MSDWKYGWDTYRKSEKESLFEYELILDAVVLHTVPTLERALKCKSNVIGLTHRKVRVS